MFDPGLAANVVFPDRVWTRLGFWVVGILTTVQPERIVRGVKVAE